MSTDCASHAKWVETNQYTTQCICTCRNQWTGRNCDQCDVAKFSGTDCDRCATGLMNYPACTVTQTVNITEMTEKCVVKCKAAVCVSSLLNKVATNDYLCSCSNCTQTKQRVCSTNGTTPQLCIYPAYNCQVMAGKPMCVINAGGKNVWTSCGKC